ncbi:N-acetylmuramoyl-L-alanine amidase [Paracoccus alkanivorans]|uniref:N-acetylmuramoyl-L-alanine amidase n=1 Tax=Paracoccus alkanivorans TaxID=2116655 RepID=A0A3M0M7V7_9RHOB|nr:N-acetylmuramoyl-L-alanine amidase [Paracoccus alkanivorans]RMC33709.1 N-acetylmuramoyl-L-alanine amidase [Paracoccus alkanivorans]
MKLALLRWLVLCLALLMPPPVLGQEAARLDIGASSLVLEENGWWREPSMELTLTLSRAVPYRAVVVGDPLRLIVDMKGADLSGLRPEDLFGHDSVPAVRWGAFRRGWSRVVIELPGPYAIASAGQQTSSPQAVIRVALEPVDEDEFTPLPSATAALRNLPPPADLPDAAPPPDGLTVVLDPGHGGFDPGAQAGGETEADVVLGFAKELRSALEAQGIKVGMTREEDRFVGLEERMTTARNARADLFLSLHADALPKGQAAGATVYVWNPNANDRAAEQLAMRHDRDDLLSGIDLKGKDDKLAAVMMDFARTDTQPRSENFARFLISRMALQDIGLHDRPVQGAAFSVLKSPDIPSALLELGFITDARDRANLTDPLWRKRMVRILVEAITGWARDERARQANLRD